MKQRAPLIDEARFVGSFSAVLFGLSYIGDNFLVLGTCLLLVGGVGLLWGLRH